MTCYLQWYVHFEVVNYHRNCCGKLASIDFPSLPRLWGRPDSRLGVPHVEVNLYIFLNSKFFWLPWFYEHNHQYNSNTFNFFGRHVNSWWLLECHDITTWSWKKSKSYIWCWVYILIEYQNVILKKFYNIIKIISG